MKNGSSLGFVTSAITAQPLAKHGKILPFTRHAGVGYDAEAFDTPEPESPLAHYAL